MENNKYQINEVFYHKEKQVFFKIKDMKFIDTVRKSSSKVKRGKSIINDWLYICEYYTKKKEVRSYYSERLDKEMIKLDKYRDDKDLLELLKTLYQFFEYKNEE